ncbi:MAG: sulfotransferase family 2 domain-containing protein [Gammaproteobacteria bacterium]|nr:sulfotransferase family 2 domain-containing protein [Gammaproteobacteria bacterium]MCD8525271.1 sulfotransferase family 2 domain-containing protein [Gammaproteobacteria bacterium]
MKSNIDHFFNHHVFVHTHIEKCGGSSLSHHMTTLFGDDHFCDLRPYPAMSALKILKCYPEVREKMPRIQVLSGHIRYHSLWGTLFPCQGRFNRFVLAMLLLRHRYQGIFGVKSGHFIDKWLSHYRKKPLYIASIRHPISRLESLFRYIRTRPEHGSYNQYVENNDFDGFIQHLMDTHSFRIRSEMCMMFSGQRQTSNLLADAKRIVDEQYFAVVPYDRTHELANMMAEVFQRPFVSAEIINASAVSEKAHATGKTRSLLEKACADDIQLYEYIMGRYAEKLNRAREQLKRQV